MKAPSQRGTEGSNLASSSGESANFRFLVQHIIRQEVAVGREAGRRSRRARLEVSEIRRVGDSHREMFIFLANGAAESEL